MTIKIYRTFVIFHKECNTVVTSGIVVEHQFKSRIPNKNKIITWGSLWFSSTEKNKGYEKTWHALTQCKCTRNIDGLIVQSTNNALSFWLSQKSLYLSTCTILLRDTLYDFTHTYRYRHIQTTKVNTSMFMSSLFTQKQSIQTVFLETKCDATHIWFLPK